MKCKDAQKECWEMENGRVSPEAEAHIKACPPCRVVFDQVTKLCRVVGLKKYERPDADFESRNLAAIRAGIRESKEAPRGILVAFGNWLQSEPVPLLRVAAAAGVMVLVGFGMISGMQQQSAPIPAAAAPTPAVQPAVVPVVAKVVEKPSVMLASTNPSLDYLVNPNLPVVFITSNRHQMLPGSGYGGLQTAPVRFQLDR